MQTFNFDSKTDYNRRYKSSMTIILLVSCALGFVVSISSDIYWGLAIAFVIFIVQYFKSERWNKIFIKSISFDKEILNLEYTDRNEDSILKGKIEEFTLKKEIALNRSRTVYLAIYINKKRVLEQFEIDDWTEAKMDEIIVALEAI